MKGKLTLAAVAVAFAMMSVPGVASAGHFGRYDWCKRDCGMWGWMDRDYCKKKVVKHTKKHYYAPKKVKKAKPAK